MKTYTIQVQNHSGDYHSSGNISEANLVDAIDAIIAEQGGIATMTISRGDPEPERQPGEPAGVQITTEPAVSIPSSASPDPIFTRQGDDDGDVVAVKEDEETEVKE